MRGSDQIYGDNGVNVDVITRELDIPWVNASVRAVRDGLAPGNDLLTGDSAGSMAGVAGEYDDVVFGDYGKVTQAIGHAVVGLAPTQPTGGYTRFSAPPERITTEGLITDARSIRFEAGGTDAINANGGDDFVFGGKQGDTIDGGVGENVVFGDHGAITGFTTFVGDIRIAGTVVT